MVVEVLLFALLIGWAVWQLVSLQRDKERAEKEEREREADDRNA